MAPCTSGVHLLVRGSSREATTTLQPQFNTVVLMQSISYLNPMSPVSLSKPYAIKTVLEGRIEDLAPSTPSLHSMVYQACLASFPTIWSNSPSGGDQLTAELLSLSIIITEFNRRDLRTQTHVTEISMSIYIMSMQRLLRAVAYQCGKQTLHSFSWCPHSFYQ